MDIAQQLASLQAQVAALQGQGQLPGQAQFTLQLGTAEPLTQQQQAVADAALLASLQQGY